MTRRAFLRSAALLAPTLFLVGCGQLKLGRQPLTTCVLIDRSGSVSPADRAIYIETLETLGTQLEGGDRLMIGALGDGGRQDFRALLDVTVETRSARLDQDDAIKAARAKVAQAIPTLMPANTVGTAASTRIVETIAAAAQAFGNPPKAGNRLLLLSDAVEDSPIVRLSRSTDNKAILAALDHARRLGMLPDLHGVELSVIGAGGAHYADVDAFWRGYSTATGATIVTYGRLPYRATS